MNFESLEQFSFYVFINSDILINEFKLMNMSLKNTILFQIENEQINKPLSIFEMKNSIIGSIFFKNQEIDPKKMNQLFSLIILAKKNYLFLFDSLMIEKCYSSIL